MGGERDLRRVAPVLPRSALSLCRLSSTPQFRAILRHKAWIIIMNLRPRSLLRAKSLHRSAIHRAYRGRNYFLIRIHREEAAGGHSGRPREFPKPYSPKVDSLGFAQRSSKARSSFGGPCTMTMSQMKCCGISRVSVSYCAAALLASVSSVQGCGLLAQLSRGCSTASGKYGQMLLLGSKVRRAWLPTEYVVFSPPNGSSSWRRRNAYGLCLGVCARSEPLAVNPQHTSRLLILVSLIN